MRLAIDIRRYCTAVPRQCGVKRIDPEPGEGDPPGQIAPGKVESRAERLGRDEADGHARARAGGGRRRRRRRSHHVALCFLLYYNRNK